MIRSVDIYPSIKGDTIIQWQLDPLAKALTSVEMEIYTSPDSVAWEKIAAVQNSYIYVDTERRTTGTQNRVFYKLVLNGKYKHIACTFISTLSKRDRAMIKTIVRKELLHQRLGGKRGVLLKRRGNGEPCGVCLSETGEATDPNCPNCFGTGFKHGYYRATKYNVQEINPSVRAATHTSKVGTYKAQATKVRGLAYPRLHTFDVWVDLATDRRYYVQDLEELTFKGIPILYSDIKLDLAPAEDIIYSIKV